MNRCPNCAAQNREGAKFCTSCGFRLPAEAPPVMTNGRSPFATTSTMPSHADELTEAPKSPESTEESGFATWNTEPSPDQGPGMSWDAAPPPNTSVPVNDEMIASLVGESATQTAAEQVEPAMVRDDTAVYRSTWEQSAPEPVRDTEASASIDQLLKLARDLEYGLMELAEVPAELAQVDTRLLSNTLADLQDEAELTPLRNAVATAQERPRDVDVMLDLVLRADAISTLLTERDQLKAAIELVLHGAANSTGETDTMPAEQDDEDSDEPIAELPAEVEETAPDDASVEADDEDSQSI